MSIIFEEIFFFRLSNSKLKYEHVYLLDKSKDKVTVICNEKDILPSILRGFSAPVLLETDFKIKEYIHILKYDNDAFNKWDAAQNLYLNCFYKDCMFLVFLFSQILCKLRILRDDGKIEM